MNQLINKKSQTGFTLVEMSVVLVVIGLILGAVSIGKDVQRNAEYTKLKQKFIDQWATAYNEHYARAGVVLGDSQTAPRFMVNGAAYTAGGTKPISGQNMKDETAPVAICEGAALMPVSTPPRPAPLLELHTRMDRLGIRMPPGRAEGSEDRYLYLDSNGNPQEVQVCFQWNKPTTPSGSGNVMVIGGLTPELARELDQMIDGKPDAQEGVFRQETILNGTSGVPGVEWGANNTEIYGGTVSTGGVGTTVGPNLDENQVITVVAHYKMNQ
ncbi:MAG: prepilin-type N-terminal cleavage/methylation domain-containing protein [Methylobacter sp.]|uniref:Prepilin-type N-terminal cleavage/methylation domain-containing protein n=1 Tax=Candidatus Methylobacter titanis TaxID=3053457 RepID=A0AA43Q321_9GAMM|nr:prepilin-type N-terminal cleavage/methylation domain-containing protein [Candidatus Methylobacter titanis]